MFETIKSFFTDTNLNYLIIILLGLVGIIIFWKYRQFKKELTAINKTQNQIQRNLTNGSLLEIPPERNLTYRIIDDESDDSEFIESPNKLKNSKIEELNESDILNQSDSKIEKLNEIDIPNPSDLKKLKINDFSNSTSDTENLKSELIIPNPSDLIKLKSNIIDTKNTENIENIENIENTENTENIIDTENIDEISSIESLGSYEEIELIDDDNIEPKIIPLPLHSISNNKDQEPLIIEQSLQDLTLNNIQEKSQIPITENITDKVETKIDSDKVEIQNVNNVNDVNDILENNETIPVVEKIKPTSQIKKKLFPLKK